MLCGGGGGGGGLPMFKDVMGGGGGRGGGGERREKHSTQKTHIQTFKQFPHMSTALKAKFDTQWNVEGDATSWVITEVLCSKEMPVIFWYSTNTQKLFAQFHAKHTTHNGFLLG